MIVYFIKFFLPFRSKASTHLRNNDEHLHTVGENTEKLMTAESFI